MRFPIKNLVIVSVALALPGMVLAGPAGVRLAPEAPGLVPSVGMPQERPTAFREGEDLQFAVKWGMITGGYSSLKIQNVEEIDGKPTYHVVAEAHSTGLVNTMYPVNDRNEAWIEPQSQSTLRYARKISEGKYRVEEQVVLDQQNHRFQQHKYRADKKRYENSEGAIPANVLDVLGSLYHARTLPLEVGKTYTIDVQSEDKVYPLALKVLRRQTVKVKAGKFDCFVVEPELRAPGIFISKGKKLEVFLTADARHMPVLMRSEIFIGYVRAELVSHRSTEPAETYALTQNATPDEDIPSVER